MKFKCQRCKAWFRTPIVEAVCSECAVKYGIKRACEEKNTQMTPSVPTPISSAPPQSDWVDGFIVGTFIMDEFYDNL